MYKLKLKFLFYVFNLVFEVLIGIHQIVDCFAGMKHCGMVLTSDLRTDSGK